MPCSFYRHSQSNLLTFFKKSLFLCMKARFPDRIVRAVGKTSMKGFF